MGFLSRAFLVFLMKESMKTRRKQPGKLMAKSCSQPVNLPGARPLMNPLTLAAKKASWTHGLWLSTFSNTYSKKTTKVLFS